MTASYVAGGELPAKERKRGISRRAALLGLARQQGGIEVYHAVNHQQCDPANTGTLGPYYTSSFSYPGEHSVSWMIGGSYLMGGSTTGKVIVSDTLYGKVYELDHSAEVAAVSWCPAKQDLPAGTDPDGWYVVLGYMATADTEGVVRVWGNEHKNLVAMRFQQSVLCLAWSPDGNFLAAGSADGTVQVWQADLSSIPAAWQNTTFN
jgi:WD40 repeat protein